jgi:hypothetical protein
LRPADRFFSFCIPSLVKEIEFDAICQAEALSSIHIPARLAKIHPRAVPGTKVRAISIDAGNRFCKIIGGFLVDLETGSIALYCNYGPDVTIPAIVRDLGYFNFDGRKGIRGVLFERGCQVSTIPDYAFSSCSSLSCICLPATVETLGERCFEDCTALSKVTFD